MAVRNTPNDTRPDHVGTQREDFFAQARKERCDWAEKVDGKAVAQYVERTNDRLNDRAARPVVRARTAIRVPLKGRPDLLIGIGPRS